MVILVIGIPSHLGEALFLRSILSSQEMPFCLGEIGNCTGAFNEVFDGDHAAIDSNDRSEVFSISCAIDYMVAFCEMFHCLASFSICTATALRDPQALRASRHSCSTHPRNRRTRNGYRYCASCHCWSSW